jgi:hypothetical protein
VGPRAGLDRCGNLANTGIRSPDRPTRSQSLYRLSYPGPLVVLEDTRTSDSRKYSFNSRTVVTDVSACG